MQSASILFANTLFHLEVIEAGIATVAIAEETHTDAFPIASMHGEWFSCRHEVTTVEAVEELVGVTEAVIPHT